MLFDVTQKVCNKGDKLTILFNGTPFEIEIVSTTVVDFERQYLVKFDDGSTRMMTAAGVLRQAN